MTRRARKHDHNNVMGVDVDGPPASWRPWKVIGTAICIDSHGSIRLWHFESDNVESWEAMGALKENLCIRESVAPDLYWEYDEDEEEDEDEYED
jgi:hypothetical protein